MIIEKIFSVLHAIMFNHQYVEITYTNSIGNTRMATGRVEIERNWCYLYDAGKDGQDYSVAFPIPNLSIRSINPIYPIAFLTNAGCLLCKHPTELSRDDTPRYIPNPRSNATYCLQDCLKDYTPIWSKNGLEKTTHVKTMNKYMFFLSIIRLKFSEIIEEADKNECKWFDLFVDESDEIGTHTIDRGNTFAEAIFRYEEYAKEYGTNKIFLDIWTHKGDNEEPSPDNIFSFWDVNYLNNYYNKYNKNESIHQ